MQRGVGMAGQPVMAPGPIQYKRQFDLLILVLLIIFCWPAAIVYYFTRPMVPVSEYQTYVQPAGAYTAPPAASPSAAPTLAPLCKTCGRPTTFIPQYNRYYCYACNQYA